MPPRARRRRPKKGPGTKGAYILLIELREAMEIEVGALGPIQFPAGRYAYVGSALSGIEPRLARHMRKSKKLHWHIDHLTASGDVIGAWIVPGGVECELNRLVEASAYECAWPRFGSSDCGCQTHLHLLDTSSLAEIEARIGPMMPTKELRTLVRR